jgi:hypothetical protein
MDAAMNNEEVGRNPELKSRTPVLEQEKQNHENQVWQQGRKRRKCMKQNVTNNHTFKTDVNKIQGWLDDATKSILDNMLPASYQKT